MSTNTKLAEALHLAEIYIQDVVAELEKIHAPNTLRHAREHLEKVHEALAAHDAEQAAQAVPAGCAEEALRAAMSEGNRLGVKSFSALRIVAAYLQAVPAPEAQAVPAGWRIQRNADGSIGLFAPPPKDGESRRTSECFTGRIGNDKEEIVFKLLDHILKAAAPAPEAQAAGQELPPLPRISHPEPRIMKFTDTECRYIQQFAEDYARAALAQRQPLTEEQIKRIGADPSVWKAHRGVGALLNQVSFARAIEAAHGISGATTGEQQR